MGGPVGSGQGGGGGYSPGAPQEYETYLDTNTGHQRLKGGALTIREPTEEDRARERAAAAGAAHYNEEDV